MNLAMNKTFNERIINIYFVCMKSIKKETIIKSEYGKFNTLCLFI